ALDVLGDADGLQGSRGVVVHLGPAGEELAHPEPRLLTGIDNEGLEAVALECLGGRSDALTGSEHAELRVGDQQPAGRQRLERLSHSRPPPTAGVRAPRPWLPR